MSDRLVTPIILSGGAGRRLWPASRDALPKQFLRLFGEESTFQATVRRLSDSELFTAPVIVTGAAHAELVIRQLAEISASARLVIEPMRRDSGPASLAAAVLVADRDPGRLILVCPADHVVRNEAAFVAAVAGARAAAETGRIVTFGLSPDRVETGFGYIRPGALIDVVHGVQAVAEFIEKPDSDRAVRLIADGALWNSGNFLMRASLLIDEYRSFEPDSARAVEEAVRQADAGPDGIGLDAESFARAVAKSIDYAVIERTGSAAVLPVDYGWSDIGGWGAVHELSAKDESGNATAGSVHIHDSRNTYVSSEGRMTAVVLGADDLVVVVRDDAVLVAHRSRLSELRDIVARIEDGKEPEQ